MDVQTDAELLEKAIARCSEDAMSNGPLDAVLSLLDALYSPQTSRNVRTEIDRLRRTIAHVKHLTSRVKRLQYLGQVSGYGRRLSDALRSREARR